MQETHCARYYWQLCKELHKKHHEQFKTNKFELFVQKRSWKVADKYVLNHSCTNGRKWQKNYILKKLCKNIYILLPIGVILGEILGWWFLFQKINFARSYCDIDIELSVAHWPLVPLHSNDVSIHYILLSWQANKLKHCVQTLFQNVKILMR